MKTSRLIVTISCFLLFLASSLIVNPGLLQAQESNRVAVVVRLGDDEEAARCVAFDEDHISGYDALRRSGFAVVAGFDAQGGTVCQIDGVGCPADDCFCQCKGGSECIYWSYWHQVNESWDYANLGATTYKVSDKQVEGWSWGPGTVSQAIEPPEVTFEEVCDSPDSNASIAPSEKGANSGNWLQYILFGAILGLFALALVFSQIRSNR